MNENELTYGETIKQPFPKLEDVGWIKIEAPDMLNATREIAIGLVAIRLGHEYQLMQNQTYLAIKGFHEKQNLFKVSWKLKQTDPHADIRAEYEKAIAEGKIVKVFELKKINQSDYAMNPIYDEVTSPAWNKDDIYKLRYYNIDWDKLLSESYASGEFVECEFSKPCGDGSEHKGLLIARNRIGLFNSDKRSTQYKVCRLAKGVEIKDEWLKEIK